MCKLSGIGLDLACNLTVLLFLVYTLHGSSHYDDDDDDDDDDDELMLNVLRCHLTY